MCVSRNLIRREGDMRIEIERASECVCVCVCVCVCICARVREYGLVRVFQVFLWWCVVVCACVCVYERPRGKVCVSEGL